MLPLLHTESKSQRTEEGRLIVCISFRGSGGSWSEGNHHGNQMREAIKQTLERDQPAGLIIDVCQLTYPGGDWIAWGCIHPGLRSCRTCLLAAGQTWDLVRQLWEVCHLDALIPVFQSLAEAEHYICSGSRKP